MRNLEQLENDQKTTENKLCRIKTERKVGDDFVEYIEGIIIDDSPRLKNSYDLYCIGKFYTSKIPIFKVDVTRPDLFPGIRRAFFESSVRLCLIQKESCPGCDHCDWINDYFDMHSYVGKWIRDLIFSDKLILGQKYRFQWRYDPENLDKRTIPKLVIVE